MIKTIKIPQELNDALYERAIELTSIQSLLNFSYSTSKYSIPQEKILKLEQEYNDINIEYQLLNKMLIDFLAENGITTKDWKLDFDL